MTGPVNIHNHRKASVHALKAISGPWEIKFRHPAWDINCVRLYHNLIAVLDADIPSDLFAIIFDFYLEPDFLAR